MSEKLGMLWKIRRWFAGQLADLRKPVQRFPLCCVNMKEART